MFFVVADLLNLEVDLLFGGWCPHAPRVARSHDDGALDRFGEQDAVLVTVAALTKHSSRPVRRCRQRRRTGAVVVTLDGIQQ